ncbi:MAG: hypothetical protein OXI29_05325 [bacterium]|nr:hypothetical protein [bacterium]
MVNPSTLLGQVADSIDAASAAVQERDFDERAKALDVGLAVFDETERMLQALCADLLQ